MQYQQAGIYVSSQWQQENKAMFSKLHSLSYERKTDTPAIGIKYVLNGEEIYRLNKKIYTVKNGSCLTMNAGQQFEVEVKQTKEAVTGMCFYIDQHLLQEVYQYYLTAGDPDISGTKTISHDIFEKVFAPDDVMSTYVHTVIRSLDAGEALYTGSSEDLFYGLGLRFLLSQQMLKKEMLQVKAKRRSTQKELYERVSLAKQMMDDMQTEMISIAEISSAVALSQFHFLRLFRQVYGISPYRYHLIKRLKHTRRQLISSTHSVTEIAFASGFTDIHTYSRAFKKHFGHAPSAIRQSHE